MTQIKGVWPMKKGKLVRDKIPEIIIADGKKPIIRMLDNDEYLQELDKKLNEEISEYQADKSVEEMAFSEIIDEMISNAWYSVLEFHIHLSGIWGEEGIKDNLERAVVKLRDLSGLEANASKVEIKNAIKQFGRLAV